MLIKFSVSCSVPPCPAPRCPRFIAGNFSASLNDAQIYIAGLHQVYFELLVVYHRGHLFSFGFKENNKFEGVQQGLNPVALAMAVKTPMACDFFPEQSSLPSALPLASTQKSTKKSNSPPKEKEKEAVRPVQVRGPVRYWSFGTGKERVFVHNPFDLSFLADTLYLRALRFLPRPAMTCAVLRLTALCCAERFLSSPLSTFRLFDELSLRVALLQRVGCWFFPASNLDLFSKFDAVNRCWFWSR